MKLDPCLIFPLALLWTMAGGLSFWAIQWVLTKIKVNASASHLAAVLTLLTISFAPLIYAIIRLPTACVNHNYTFLEVILFSGWFLGAGVILIRIAFALICLRRLRYESKLLDIDIAHFMETPCRNLRLKNLEIRESSSNTMRVPITWGFLRPVILLPPNSTKWNENRFKAAILHEIAHVQRGDSLARLICHLVLAVHWFNPLIWLAFQKVESQAEIAADDIVVLKGMIPSDYANELLSIAVQDRGGICVTGVASAMVNKSSLEQRIRSILDPCIRKKQAGWRQQITLAGAIVAIVLFVGWAASAFYLPPKAPACIAQRQP